MNCALSSVTESCCCCLKKNLNAPRPSEHPPVWGKKCQNVVVSHIQRIGCQPGKTTLHGGQSRSWSAEQGKKEGKWTKVGIPTPFSDKVGASSPLAITPNRSQSNPDDMITLPRPIQSVGMDLHDVSGTSTGQTLPREGLHRAPTYVRQFGGYTHHLLLFSTPVAQSAPRNLLTRWDVSSIPANGIFLTKNKKNKIKMPNGWRTINSLVHKIRLHGRRGKGMAESFSRQKSRHAAQKEGGLKILCDLPPV